MSDEMEPGDWEVEQMLKQVPLAGPSNALDRRMTELFRPRWRMWIGPIAGFAAGVAATLAVVFILPHQSTGTSDLRTTRTADVTPPAPAPAPTPKPRPGLLIEDQQVRTLDGDVDGRPMRLEYRQPHLIFLENADNGSLQRTDMSLPGKAFVRAVQSN